jgi:DNA-binding Lrp family transcriptional regulator
MILDAVDWKIISLLIADARVTHRTIAREVSITEATVAARLGKLLKQNVVRIIPVYDWRVAGYAIDAFCFIQVSRRPPSEVSAILGLLEGVLSIGTTFGATDLVAVLVSPSEQEFYDTLSKIEAIDGVFEIHTERIQDVFSFISSWTSLPPKFTRPDRLPEPAIVLDTLDRKIISLLETDGRTSSREMARKLHVHDAKIRSRIRRMEESGLMGLRTVIDPSRTGIPLEPRYILGINTVGNPEAVAQRLQVLPESWFVAVTHGRFNVTAIISGPRAEEMSDFIDTNLWSQNDIRNVRVLPVANLVKLVPGLWCL